MDSRYTMEPPKLSSKYVVTEDKIKLYNEQGHILLKGVAAPEEVEYYRTHIVDMANRLNHDARPMRERYFYGKALLQTMNTWRRSEIIKSFVFSKRFSKIAADLMIVDRVRLNHDCVLLKEPKADRTPWHQDQQVWPIDTNNTVTMWMPLTDVTRDMGTMSFISGSHRWGDITENPYKRLTKAIRDRVQEVNYGDMSVGDAIFHHGWMFHGAKPNMTDQKREVATIIYYEDGARIVDPDGDYNRETHLRRYFPGLSPGDYAVTAINPVLYSRY